VIGVLGILDDASKVVKIAFRNAGDVIVLLDGYPTAIPNPPWRARNLLFLVDVLSGIFLERIFEDRRGIVAGGPPAINLAAEKRLIDCLVTLASDGVVASAHDISDGGLAVTLAESCFASVVAGLQTGSFSIGAAIHVPKADLPENAFFGERGARCVVSVSPAKLAPFRQLRDNITSRSAKSPGHRKRFAAHRI